MSRTVVPRAALLWCVWTMLTVEAGLGPVRSVSVLLFFLLVPGLAVTGWLEIDDAVFEGTVVLGIGAAVGITIGQILVWTSWWSPVVAMWLLALACAVSFVLQLRASRHATADLQGEQ